jgi:iron(III) transport system substrate-binding protein
MLRRAGLSTALSAVALVVAHAACDRRPVPPPSTSAPASAPSVEVVVYTALDREFSEPILNDFTARTGIKALAAYDTESTKTVGLVNRIRAEVHRPRCDVFWNNEILNTVRLKSEGLLQPCTPPPPQARFYPAQYRDPDGYWFGFAARARVIIVNTNLVRPEDRPDSIYDLADPQWRGRTGIAKPLFGTTASHVACLFARLGPDDARRLLASFKANDIQIASGNKGCAQMVAAGALAFGLTDTDDALIEREAGKPVAIVFPDGAAPATLAASRPAADGADAGARVLSRTATPASARTSGMGPLLLPNTLAVVKGAPHPDAAAKLIDFLLSPEVEARLAIGPSAQIPLNSRCTAVSRACRLADLRPMEVDFAAAAAQFPAAAAYVEAEFLK